MGRKDSFNPVNLQKDKQFAKLKYGDLIEWTKQNAKPKASAKAKSPKGKKNAKTVKVKDEETLKDFFEYIKEYASFDDKFDMTIFKMEEFQDHLIIGKCEINTHMKFTGKDQKEYMYIVSDDEYKNIWLSIGKCFPICWYKYTSKKQFFDSFDNIYETYNREKYSLGLEKTSRAFIGTEQMLTLSIEDLENHMVLNPNTEDILWGSKWKDHPFRAIYMNKEISKSDDAMFSIQAMQQLDEETYTSSVRTEFSKSIITFEDYNGAFIVDVQYNPVDSPQVVEINREIERQYPLDMPTDVVQTLMNLPYVTHTGLLKLRPVTSYTFVVSTLIANNRTMYEELIPEIKVILEESDDESVLEFGKIFLNNLEKNTKLDDVFGDKKIEEFIKKKIDNLQGEVQTLEEVRDEIWVELDKKLEQLNFNDQEFKAHVTNIINSILNLSEEVTHKRKMEKLKKLNDYDSDDDEIIEDEDEYNDKFAKN
jgi:hypothetical protein